MALTADMGNLEMIASEVSESSAWGAAMNGLLGSGHCKTFDDLAALPRTTRSFRPKMDPAQRQKFYEGWQAAVKRVL